MTHRVCSPRRRLTLLEAGLRGPDAVYLQPIVDVDGVVVAVEALARYDAVNPLSVFAAAAAAGLRVNAELAAARTAVVALAAVSADVRLTVNMSASTLADEAAAALLGPVAGRLWVEVTEAEPVLAGSQTLRNLAELRAAGALVVVDDAGAQHSTVEQVTRLAADVVKLDCAVVQGAIAADPRSLERLERLVTAASTLGAHVVAEGIEELTDIAPIVALGAGLLQGYAVGRPQPAFPLHAA